MSTHENPSRPLRVTILQTDIEWQAPSANLARLTRLLHEAPKSDLYLLPEMFATGFCMNPEVPGVSDAAADTFRWMQHEAEELDSAIAGSLPVEVLIERTDGAAAAHGWSSEYLPVRFAQLGPADEGMLLRGRVTAADGETLLAERTE